MPEHLGLRVGPTCDADWVSEHFGCEAPSRFRVERQDDDGSYGPGEACPAHVADMLASMADGDDVPLTVRVRFDEPTSWG